MLLFGFGLASLLLAGAMLRRARGK
jgi:hypothetical protein